MTLPAKTSPAVGSLADTLHRKLTDRTARVGVVGLGYVGLPLLIEFARGGFHAVGIDIDPRKIATINRGESYIQDVAARDIAEMAAAGRLATVRLRPAAGAHAPVLDLLFASSGIEPEIDRVLPMADAREGFAAMASGDIYGKIVFELD